jgi:hypothetical protein
MRRLLLLVLATGLPLLGCPAAPKTAALTGRWVVVAEPAKAGTASAPKDGASLSLATPADCMTEQELRDHFGNTCDRHESEAAASSTMDGSFGPGEHSTPGQPRWYCACPMVARVILDRCESGSTSTSTFRVRQVALALNGGCQ